MGWPAHRGVDSRRRLLCSLLLAFGVLGASLASGAPVAGTRIQNRATAVYLDPATASPTALQSNPVQVTVLGVEGVDVAADRLASHPAGTSVSLPHTITNTGNVTTAFTLSFSNLGGDDYEFWSLQLFVDANRNGVGDSGETQLANGASVTLRPGESLAVVLQAILPGALSAGATGQLSLSATGTDPATTDANVDTVEVVDGAWIDVVKSAATLDPAPGDVVRFGLAQTNVGGSLAGGIPVTVDGSSATLVVLRDGIPAGASFVDVVDAGAATALYHYASDAPDVFRTAPPATASDVDEIAFGVPSLAVGASVGVSFRLEIDPLFSGVTISNTAEADFDDGVGPGTSTSPSNTIVLAIDAPLASIAYHQDASFSATVATSVVGTPLFVEAAAASCNLDPGAVELRSIQLESLLTGDLESFSASETGADTGVFRILPNVPTADAVVSPVAPGNGTLETRVDDSITASLLDCGSGSEVSAAILIELAGSGTELFLEKEPSRYAVELGEFLDYTLLLRNNSGRALTDVELEDQLPTGFRYVSGSARLEGTRLADPAGGAGPSLVFALGSLPADEVVRLGYRVQIGPGALRGDAVNRARAYSASNPTQGSNTASARVEIVEGVFSDRGFILGKVFVDTDFDGEQDPGEPGVPDVALFLEDGTYAVTDGQGMYSFYGVRPRTHGLKLDRTTLPPGSRLRLLSNRSALDPGSRFVDLKNGELQGADFALAPNPEVLAAVEERRIIAGTRVAELDESLDRELQTEPTLLPIENVKARPASGIVARAGNDIAPPRPADPELPAEITHLPPPPLREAPSVPLEQLVLELEEGAGFVDLADGDVLPGRVANVRVKGAAGSTLALRVNGEVVADDRVGQRAVVPARGIQAWEYVNVRLGPGRNRLELMEVDAAGNPRGGAVIDVTSPGELARLRIELPDTLTADPTQTVPVRVRVEDVEGTPVTARTPLTLETSLGGWETPDLDPTEPGLQLFAVGGFADAELVPSADPGEGRMRATSGLLEVERVLAFGVNLRPLIAIGVVEGRLDFRHLDTGDMFSAQSADGFEDAIDELAQEGDGGRIRSGVRGAMFLKGEVKGDALLTMRYDSEKDPDERLFRDIEPDRFYPVYGDSSLRGFEAQSTGSLYLRVDKERSWLLYGDYATQEVDDAVDLGDYSRSLTGLRGHWEADRLAFDAFASQGDARQEIEEIRGRGISGPYALEHTNVRANSEQVEIVVRDRNQPSLVLERRPLARFTDYEIDPIGGTLLFREPLPSVDANLNPIFARVVYDVEDALGDYWVTGLATRLRPFEGLELGARFVDDQNPEDPLELRSAHMSLRLGDQSRVVAEVAESLQDGARGNAARVDLRHTGRWLDTWAYWAQTDTDFENPSSRFVSGRLEMGLRSTLRLTDSTRLLGEALLTEDELTDGRRRGGQITLEQRLTDWLRGEVGVRHVRETRTPAAFDTALDDVTPFRNTSARAKLTAQLPFLPALSVFGEYEQELSQSDGRTASVGGEWQAGNRTRLYARHEFLSAFSGPYTLNSEQGRHATLFGIESDYVANTSVFSEYRVNEVIAGRDAEAAMGLRHRWAIAPDLRLNTSFERIHSLEGRDDGDATAAALGLSWVPSSRWKGTARVEYRHSETRDTFLNSFGLASKIDDNWSFLGRTLLHLNDARSGSDGDDLLGRLQTGFAYRPSETNLWNALGRYEFEYEKDRDGGSRNRRIVHVASLHGDYKPRRRLRTNGRYAVKWVDDRSSGLDAGAWSHLTSARLTYDLSERWDVGFLTGALFDGGFASVEYALGTELGYLLTRNLWLSVGYNHFGLEDDDLVGADYSTPGAYLRFRFKFDEDALQWLAE
jgi:uncharacterized repeat protein (TIGR01451 family)